ncbi:MAG: hypothetical protein LBI63_04860 [Candidatus Ancillula sp.]|jgi:hypothetical protein|nr:hypothetical protein [Candidatus Ancillula sp.]
MFLKLYTPIAIIVAILIAVFSVFSDTIFQNGSDITSSISTPIENGKIFIMTDSGVLDLVGNTVGVSVDSGENVDLEVAVGQNSDIVAYLANDTYTRITDMKSWTDLNSVQMPQTEPKTPPTVSDIHSDMWEYYNTGKGHMNFDWTKKSGATWSLLVFAKVPADNAVAANAKQEVGVKLNWKRKTSKQFMIPGLSISLLIMVGCLVMHLVYKSKNVRGRHSGEAKRLAELISDKTGEFVLPMSAKIQSVREFAKIEKNAANQSLLPSLNATANAQSYHVSYGVENNNWRYYGDDAPSPSPYEGQIAYTQSMPTYPAGLNRQIYPTPANLDMQIDHTTTQMYQPPVAPNIELSSTFSAVSRLESAPQESDIQLLTRKELRDKGFFKTKKKKKKEES